MKKIKLSEMNEASQKEYKKKRWALIGMYAWLAAAAVGFFILLIMYAEGNINIPAFSGNAELLQLFVGFLLLIVPPIVAILNIEPELRKMRTPNESQDYGDDYVGDAELDAHEQDFKDNENSEEDEYRKKLRRLRIRRNVYAAISIGVGLLTFFALDHKIHEAFLIPSVLLFPIAIIALIVAAIKIVLLKGKKGTL